MARFLFFDSVVPDDIPRPAGRSHQKTIPASGGRTRPDASWPARPRPLTREYVPLTSEMPFGLSTKEGEKKARKHLEALATRTVFDIEALHYLETQGGWIDLDLSVSAPTVERLDEKVIVKLREPDMRPCRHAERSLWIRMTRCRFLRYRTLFCPGGPRVYYVVAECTEL